MTSTSVASPSFGDLALLPAVLSAVESQGYLVPSPIQAQPQRLHYRYCHV